MIRVFPLVLSLGLVASTTLAQVASISATSGDGTLLTVDELLELAKHEDPEQRSMAAYQLGLQQDERALPAIRPLLNDPEARVRESAVRSHLRLSGELAPLTPLLHDPEPHIRSTVVYAYADLDGDVEAIRDMLDDADAYVRSAAVHSFLDLGGEIDAVEPLLDDPDSHVQLVVCRRLVIADRRFEAVVRTLVAIASGKGEDSFDAEHTFQAFSKVRAQNAVQPLLDVLRETDSSAERFHAFQALAAADGIGPDHTENIAELLDHPAPAVRRRAVELLIQIDSDAAAARPRLLQALTDGDLAVRAMVAAALYSLGERQPEVIDNLRHILQGDEHEGRTEVLDALKRHPGAGTELITELINVLGRRNEFHRADAAAILAGLGPQVVPTMVAEIESPDALLTHAYLWEGIANVLHDIGPPASDAIPALLLLSEFPGPRVHKAAVEALAAVGSGQPDAFMRVRELTLSMDIGVRTHATKHLVQAAGMDAQLRSEAEAALRLRLADPEPSIKVQAAEALRQLDVDPAVILPVLDRVVHGEDGQAARDALDVYSALGPDAVPSIGVLMEALGGDLSIPAGFHAWPLRDSVPFALAAIGPQAIPALIEALQDSDPQLRALAAIALGQFGPDAREAVPHLTRLVSDDNRMLVTGFVYYEAAVAEPVIEALGKIGVAPNGLIEELISLVEQYETVEWLDARPTKAARTLGGLGSAAEPALPALWHMADTGSFGAQAAALGAIARITPDDPRVVPTIRELLMKLVEADAASPSLGMTAGFYEVFEMIEWLDDRAQGLIPTLESLIVDAPLVDPSYRCDAAVTLATIEPSHELPFKFLQRQVEIEARSSGYINDAQRALDVLEYRSITPP